MGCFCSQPLQKVAGHKLPDNLVPKEEVNMGEDYEKNEEEEAIEQKRPYYSFTSFILQSQDAIIFEWKFKNEIGKGAMSRVFYAENIENGTKCAAKVYNKLTLLRPTLGGEDPPYLAVQREISIMAKISHRFVLPINEVIDDDITNSLIILMPYAQYGTLASYLNSREVSESTIQRAFYQIAEGLRCIHSLNIIHRDIKPDNILVFEDDHFCLSDFSVSSVLESPDEKLIDTRGSPAFLSPEECDGDPFLPKPADVWAFGVSLYSVVFRQLPFDLDRAQGKTVANTIFAVTELLSKGRLEFPDEGANPALVDLLKRTLEMAPEQRITFEDIVLHEWFAEARSEDSDGGCTKAAWATEQPIRRRESLEVTEPGSDVCL